MNGVTEDRDGRPKAGLRAPIGYGTGKVSIARGSTVLRGSGTQWHALSRGRVPSTPRRGFIVIDGGEEAYEVHLINSDSLITLKRPFDREDVSEASYQFFDSSLVRDGLVPASVARAAGASAQRTKEEPDENDDGEDSESPIGEILRTIAYALLIAIVIRIFLFQPFNIPSGSMVPTLLEGDYIFVSKYAYGYSRHSVPFSPPLFSGRVWGKLPERGDVAVFKLPSDGRTDYIKRIIGLPGDRIQVTDGVLHINGAPVERARLDDFVVRESFGSVRRTPRYQETLPNGVSHVVLDSEPSGTYDNTGEFVVPQGYLFAMGDNRDNSLDSRAQPDYDTPRHGGVGYVPIENLVGRAEIIFFSTNGTARVWEFWNWPTATRWGRLFDRID